MKVLKLNNDEQNVIIENFETNEKKIAEETLVTGITNHEIPTGFLWKVLRHENNSDIHNDFASNQIKSESIEKHEEHTPKLFSEDLSHEETDLSNEKENENNDQLFDQDTNEEDFEIPAFLRRQKF